MEVVLYLEFNQHPSLRTLLLRSGLAGICWGDSPLGEGASELDKALVRLRERLRQESEN